MACLEEEVGITEYLSQSIAGFNGKIKVRFSDFNVIEIDPKGQLVSLKNKPGDDVSDENGKSGSSGESYEDMSTELQALISKELFTELRSLEDSDQAKKFVDIPVTSLSKESRTQVHQFIKSLSLVGNTETNSAGEKVIRAALPNKNEKQPTRGRSKQEKFMHFTLYKEGQSTSECLSRLAAKIRTKDKYFMFSGTKDKRGRTSQRVSIAFVKPNSVKGAAEALRKQNCKVAVGDFSFHPEALRMGDLQGNRFEIVVKNVDKSREEVAPMMEEFKEHGFINYFGMQRFGTSEIPTHKVGLELLREDYSKAINLILAPRPTQYQELRTVLEKYEKEGDAKAALNQLPNRFKFSIEGKLLYGLTKHHQNDKVNVLNSLPRPTVQMYAHAYQSYIWNRTVSARLARHGRAVLPGDLVRDPTKTDGGVTTESLMPVSNPSEFTLHEVYLPIPGHDIELPQNETAQLMLDVLKEDNLSLDSFKCRSKDYALPGDYRSILAKGGDVEWSMLQYTCNEDDLLHSQFELSQSEANTTDQSQLRIIPNTGDLTAFVVKLSLPSSTYATMALREIMRVKTDVRSMRGISNGATAESEVDTKKSANSTDGESANGESEKSAEIAENGSTAKRESEDKNALVSKKQKVV